MDMKVGFVHEVLKQPSRKLQPWTVLTTSNFTPAKTNGVIGLDYCVLLCLNTECCFVDEYSIEKCMDLCDFDYESVWTIDITEQAHKFFQNNMKRQHYLCNRMKRRLKIISTGRWPYVLCKLLFNFSPRWSSINCRFCETVSSIIHKPVCLLIWK